MGIKPAPPDSWVYRQGTVFLIDHTKPAKPAEHLVDQDDDDDDHGGAQS